jgi:tetratricopeptide (TPR) repeat protein
MHIKFFFAFLLITIIAACSGAGSEPTRAPLAVDVFDEARRIQVCAQVEAAWENDWELVIAALEVLVLHDADCTPDQPSDGKLYAAHYNYGALLESQQAPADAIEQYQAALQYRPDGREALEGLRRLGGEAPPPPPLQTCAPGHTEELAAAVPPYHPASDADFVTVVDDGFAAGGVGFVPRGINYFPRDFPWRRFLTESDFETIQSELHLIRQTGFNSLRLFLWHEALFTCPADGAIPQAQAFALLDRIIAEAAALDFRLIVTLNDLPDLTSYPLYENPDHVREQTAYIVTRYRDEPTIMAWDVRNEGDIDWRRNEGISQEMVITWLGEVISQVRALDTNHLITAGWLRDEMSTEPLVDFVSFHYWSHSDGLEARISETLAATDKPVLMEEFGYSTFNVPPETQRDLLSASITIAEDLGVAGWLIWAAFDFPLDATCIPPACPSDDNQEHHFGIWTVDYEPKPAVEVLEQMLATP